MKKTKHAQIRSQQRGIKDEQLILISIFGEELYRDKDGIAITITKKMISHLKQLLDKCNQKVIISDLVYDNIITTFCMKNS